VVATSVGGNTELVSKGNGICVPPDDPLALADALATLARNKPLRQQLGQNSRKILEGTYSWEKTIAKYIGYYGEMLTFHRQNRVAGMIIQDDRG
jgi:glycosyltransferase involved in cell wall biosynthesis